MGNWPHGWPSYRDDGYLEFALEQTVFPEGPEFANGTSLADQFAALFVAGDMRFDASRFNVDGVTGKVGSFIDYIDATHLLVQATSAAQVAVPAADSSMSNALVGNFLGAQTYKSNKAASVWEFLHDGTGCEIWQVFKPTNLAGFQLLLSNSSGGTRGLISYLNSGTYGRGIYRTGTSALFGPVGYGSALTVNVPVTTCFSHSTANSPDTWTKVTGQAAVTADYTNPPPDSGAPAATLDFFSNGSSGHFIGTWRSTYFFKRVLSPAERAIVAAFITSETGVSS